MKNFQELVKKLTFPKQVGVYRFYDAKKTLLYVGKANNLESRIKQYSKGAKNSYKTELLIKKTKEIKYDIVSNETEALILEKKIISESQPIYNIKLKDDQNYPYIKLELKKKLSISLVYKIFLKNKEKNTFFFGPFLNKSGAFALKKLLENIALYEKGELIELSEPEILAKKFLLCKKILQGQKFIAFCEEKLENAKKNFQFELAKEYHKSILALKKLKIEHQNININNSKNLDFLYYSKVDANNLIISFSFYRNGAFFATKNFILEIILDDLEILVNFLNKYYKNNIYPDELIVTDFRLKNSKFLNTNIKIKVKVAKGRKHMQILKTLKTNHEDFIKHNFNQELQKKMKNEKILQSIKENLGIKSTEKIMAIDNSNLDANYATTGIIFYINGNYERNYNRFFNYFGSKKGDVNYMKQGFEKYIRNKKFIKPDLILVDGGVQQVNSILDILKKNNLEIPIYGMVKNVRHKTQKIIDENGKKVLISQEILNFFTEIQENVDLFVKTQMKKKQRKNLLPR
ncbi:excinuclease ABC subunit C [Mycoplasma flocculare]|uniref:Excinuclease ABC subunit C n=1 Tax=Mesomycoplasma flocculare TaxID=2128 RepID=A0AAW9XBE6_MESFC|nr:GIY-YIG nuclease family protein [Mesomycoplasma flocculare]MXR05685.1 excinuclease ABC subunit C [Mesomycoplasma flocculare]MXR13315.1 excinuclease ABC subunit C [Mesomycoplasma flocculare]MXR55940.1 excinuclease ABC subunit C [Mesomycoplasma flocculare]MXR56539.1 excinuclease ABC subunit C [Mesomycoplasma flocculare]